MTDRATDSGEVTLNVDLCSGSTDGEKGKKSRCGKNDSPFWAQGAGQSFLSAKKEGRKKSVRASFGIIPTITIWRWATSEKYHEHGGLLGTRKNEPSPARIDPSTFFLKGKKPLGIKGQGER